MTKYKINRDQPPKAPTKEQMDKYKDFSRLTANYDSVTKRPKLPLYKNKKLFLVVLLLLLILYLIWTAGAEK